VRSRRGHGQHDAGPARRVLRRLRLPDQGVGPPLPAPGAPHSRQERFEFGLDCVLDGIAARLRALPGGRSDQETRSASWRAPSDDGPCPAGLNAWGSRPRCSCRIAAPCPVSQTTHRGRRMTHPLSHKAASRAAPSAPDKWWRCSVQSVRNRSKGRAGRGARSRAGRWTSSLTFGMLRLNKNERSS
jgi:hypothetical protein